MEAPIRKDTTHRQLFAYHFLLVEHLLQFDANVCQRRRQISGRIVAVLGCWLTVPAVIVSAFVSNWDSLRTAAAAVAAAVAAACAAGSGIRCRVHFTRIALPSPVTGHSLCQPKHSHTVSARREKESKQHNQKQSGSGAQFLCSPAGGGKVIATWRQSSSSSSAAAAVAAPLFPPNYREEVTIDC